MLIATVVAASVRVVDSALACACRSSKWEAQCSLLSLLLLLLLMVSLVSSLLLLFRLLLFAHFVALQWTFPLLMLLRLWLCC